MTLSKLGYKISAKKAQLCLQKVTYLGYEIQKRERTLSPQKVCAVLQIFTPKVKKQVCKFLGAIGYCRIWIISFAEIAQPLYDTLRGKTQNTLE